MLENYAPSSLVWAPGGTKRYSKMQEISIANYPTWFIESGIADVCRFFELGVATVFFPIITPNNFREEGVYKEMIYEYGATIFTNEKALELYKKNNIRVKFYGHRLLAKILNNGQEFLAQCQNVMDETKDNPHSLWWGFATSEEDILWDIISSGIKASVESFDALITNYYGEHLEQVQMLIATGKFQAGSLIPPLLAQNAALYWTDFPAQMLRQEDIQRIFHDFAVERKTWTADKANRLVSFDVNKLEARYKRRIIWGIGTQDDGYWHHSLYSE